MAITAEPLPSSNADLKEVLTRAQTALAAWLSGDPAYLDHHEALKLYLDPSIDDPGDAIRDLMFRIGERVIGPEARGPFDSSTISQQVSEKFPLVEQREPEASQDDFQFEWVLEDWRDDWRPVNESTEAIIQYLQFSILRLDWMRTYMPDGMEVAATEVLEHAYMLVRHLQNTRRFSRILALRAVPAVSPARAADAIQELLNSIAEESQTARQTKAFEASTHDHRSISARQVDSNLVVNEDATSEADIAPFEFYPDGDVFIVNGFGESGNVVATKGIKQIHMMLIHQDEVVTYAELSSMDERQRADGHSRQPIIDREGLKEIECRISEAKGELEKARLNGDSVEEEQCQREVNQLREELGKMVNHKGVVKDINNPANKLRPSVNGTLKTAYDKLRKAGLMKTAGHFESSIGADGTGSGFGYQPGDVFPGRWKTEE